MTNEPMEEPIEEPIIDDRGTIWIPLAGLPAGTTIQITVVIGSGDAPIVAMNQSPADEFAAPRKRYLGGH